jgi:hypothetical protein
LVTNKIQDLFSQPAITKWLIENIQGGLAAAFNEAGAIVLRFQERKKRDNLLLVAPLEAQTPAWPPAYQIETMMRYAEACIVWGGEPGP